MRTVRDMPAHGCNRPVEPWGADVGLPGTRFTILVRRQGYPRPCRCGSEAGGGEIVIDAYLPPSHPGLAVSFTSVGGPSVPFVVKAWDGFAGGSGSASSGTWITSPGCSLGGPFFNSISD